MEVSTPLLDSHTVTDPHIQSFQLSAGFLQTSPEYAMKKLLATSSGPIYSLGKVFRQGESGSRHRPEFTMLEWYRPGFSLNDLQLEVADLLREVCKLQDLPVPEIRESSYREVFEARYGLNPHQASVPELQQLTVGTFPNAIQHLDLTSTDPGIRNDLLDVLFAEGIEPELQDVHFVSGFPATQAALANTGMREGDEVALRFELFWQGMELANGYDELRDPGVLEERARSDNQIRQARGLPNIDVDEALLIALPLMPVCSGVALGVDRLLMLLCGADNLNQVL